MRCLSLQSLSSLSATFQVGVGAVEDAIERASVKPRQTHDGMAFYDDAAVEKIGAALKAKRTADFNPLANLETRTKGRHK